MKIGSESIESYDNNLVWIPAVAGMTYGGAVAGMTEGILADSTSPSPPYKGGAIHALYFARLTFQGGGCYAVSDLVTNHLCAEFIRSRGDRTEHGGQSVRIVTQEPQGCKDLGDVTGNPENFFTGGFTSNANLETGARNDMKNHAQQMGGNTVQLITNRAGQTGRYGQGSRSMEQTNVTYSGTVYSCPEGK